MKNQSGVLYQYWATQRIISLLSFVRDQFIKVLGLNFKQMKADAVKIIEEFEIKCEINNFLYEFKEARGS